MSAGDGKRLFAVGLNGFEFRVLSGVYRKALTSILNNVSEGNKSIIYRFLEEDCVKKGLTELRRTKYIRIISKLVYSMGNRILTEINKSDMDNFFFYLKSSELSDPTKEDYWNMFRIFSEYLNPNLGIRTYKLKTKKKHKLPEEIFKEEEIKKIIESAYSTRDKALLSLLYHGALRPLELTSARIMDLTFDQYGAVLMVREINKTGSRRLRLIEPVPLLSQYLQEHRYREDPYAPLFYRQDRYTKTHLQAKSLSWLLKNCAKRAGINKGRIYAYLLRHSRLTHLSKHLTSQKVMVFAGHTQLATTQIYVHLSGTDVENKLLKINGIVKQEENTAILKPQACVRCNSQADASSKYCPKCGMVLSQKEAFDMKNKENLEFKDFVAEMFKKWKEGKTQNPTLNTFN